MRYASNLTCFLLAACSATAWADVQSGLQPGDTPSAFHVEDVTGPRKGNSLCYACAFGKHRVVNIQVTRFSDELVELIKNLDSIVDSPESIKGESVHAFVVYLTEDPDIAFDELEEIARSHHIRNVPLTVYDELPGPPPYRISEAAEVTVMMWAGMKVTSNHAFGPGEFPAEAVRSVIQAARQHLRPVNK